MTVGACPGQGSSGSGQGIGGGSKGAEGTRKAPSGAEADERLLPATLTSPLCALLCTRQGWRGGRRAAAAAAWRCWARPPCLMMSGWAGRTTAQCWISCWVRLLGMGAGRLGFAHALAGKGGQGGGGRRCLPASAAIAAPQCMRAPVPRPALLCTESRCRLDAQGPSLQASCLPLCGKCKLAWAGMQGSRAGTVRPAAAVTTPLHPLRPRPHPAACLPRTWESPTLLTRGPSRT